MSLLLICQCRDSTSSSAAELRSSMSKVCFRDDFAVTLAIRSIRFRSLVVSVINTSPVGNDCPDVSSVVKVKLHPPFFGIQEDMVGFVVAHGQETQPGREHGP